MTVAALRARIAGWRADGAVIGLAPTMGGLHAGHLALVDALREAGATRIVATIFVNPTQFAEGEDFAAYPRSLDCDREKLASADVDLLFAPPVEEIYPSDIDTPAMIDLPGLTGDLCGAYRPRHFSGVATVVAKLFNMATPGLAAFGEKDYQQLVVIRSMAASLNFPVRIVAVPTVRETDGLAMSSRNAYLDASERAKAPAIHRALAAAREAILAGDPVHDTAERARDDLETLGFSVDYVDVRRAGDLSEPADGETDLVILAAARLGSTRLIDNLRIRLR